MPRPSLKTPRLIKHILDLITAGENISSICARKGMPDRRTVHRWLLEDPGFHKAYKKAVSLRAHNTLLDIVEIADRPKASFTDVVADKLRVEARLRMAHMLNPALKIKNRKKKKPKPETQLPDELEFIVRRPNETNEAPETN